MRYHLIDLFLSKRQEIMRIFENVVRRESLCTVGGNFTLGYLSDENKNTNLKRYVQPDVHCRII